MKTKIFVLLLSIAFYFLITWGLLELTRWIVGDNHFIIAIVIGLFFFFDNTKNFKKWG